MVMKTASHRRDVASVLWLGLLSLLLSGCDARMMATPDIELRGAGATFPAPLYERWFGNLANQYPGLDISYDVVGSGAGTRQFIDEMVDFGASDEPLTDKEIAQVDRGVRLLPMTSGAIVLAYHLQDTGGEPVVDLRLSREAYVNIFLGKITHWDDEEIVRHNPGVALPKAPIQVEYRLDSSGSTAAFTRHLCAVSDSWKDGPGYGKSIVWPVGAGMPKDRGIAHALRQVPGSIGYVSYTFASQELLSMASLENRAGEFVKPTTEAIQIALSDLPESHDDLRILITDPGDVEAYPIVTYSWIFCYRIYQNPAKLALLKKMLAYGLQEGQQVSGEMGYVPLPDEMAHRARAMLGEITLPVNADMATEVPMPKIESDFSTVLTSEAGKQQKKDASQAEILSTEHDDPPLDDPPAQEPADIDAEGDLDRSDQRSREEAGDVSNSNNLDDDQEAPPNTSSTRPPDEAT